MFVCSTGSGPSTVCRRFNGSLSFRSLFSAIVNIFSLSAKVSLNRGSSAFQKEQMSDGPVAACCGVAPSLKINVGFNKCLL